MKHVVTTARVLLLATLILAFTPEAYGQDIQNTSFTAPDGAPILQHRAMLKASLQEAWDAFTTTEGVIAWGAPHAEIDFRMGGLWETNYSRAIEKGDPGNIRWRYVSYVPLQLITLKAENAPTGFPHRELFPRLDLVVTLEAVNQGQTLIVLSLVGFNQDPGMQEIYNFFESGNEYSFKLLRKRFEEGPIDWQALRSPETRAN